jgi:protein-S-isoprenylcysteine O-methyltransferase Ste14
MKINLPVLAGQVIFLFLAFALLLFLPAGTIAWPAAWTFLALFFVFVIAITAWLYQYNPGLLRERMKVSSPDQKAIDRVLFLVLQFGVVAWLILMPLDAVRFHWSQVPLVLQGVGTVLLLCSFYIFFITFRENSYLSPLIRIQHEREQTVVSSGPYHYVRHPMYAAAVLWMIGTALLLGSWYGVLWALVLVVLIGRRAMLEEHILRAELQGYDRYMSEVKYRFVPYVW